MGAAWDCFCVNFNTVEVFRGASEPSQTAERIVRTKLDPSVSYVKPRLSEEEPCKTQSCLIDSQCPQGFDLCNIVGFGGKRSFLAISHFENPLDK